MSDVRERAPEETVAIDGDFIREETRAALRALIAPYVGLYEAATGKERRFVKRKRLLRRGRKAA